MFLYLVQHAEAMREDEDLARPISQKGLDDISRVAAYVSLLNISISEILHSPKLRAEQTAGVLFQNLKPVRGMKETDGLSPLDDPNIWADRLRDRKDDVILVGHLPHLSKLASLLLFGDSGKNLISFKMAGVVCLRRDDSGAWSLEWMLTPEIVVGEKGMETSCDSL
ncbi:MAG TPA: phosphohistidine phosphatase SixA, partial [Thermodesulfovibrionales bacterium]|nr:phosphohistidine phosphatase SixA [Thermodesulfovibrionales bacterium]